MSRREFSRGLLERKVSSRGETLNRAVELDAAWWGNPHVEAAGARNVECGRHGRDGGPVGHAEKWNCPAAQEWVRRSVCAANQHPEGLWTLPARSQGL